MPHRLITNGELILYGPVGLSFWDDEGFSAQEVVQALAEVDGDVTVRLNSGGGIAFDGIAIHNALRSHEGKVTVIVEAIAASAASVVAMAGDEIIMPDGAMMMIHDASGITIGTADDHTKTAQVLDKLDGELARIYARRSGKKAAELRTMMDSETWFDGPEAVAAGFATRAGDGEAEEPTAFDYRIYAHPPERLVALAQARGWRATNDLQAGRRLAPRNRQQEVSMPTKIETGTETETADVAALRAELDALKAENATLKAEKSAEDGKVANAEHAEIAEMALAAGVPSMTAALIKEGVKPAAAKARIDSAKDIKAEVELARKICPTIEATLADQFVAAGASLETVRAALFEKMAAASPEISARHDNSAITAGKGGQDTAANAAGWAKAAAATNARFGRA